MKNIPKSETKIVKGYSTPAFMSIVVLIFLLFSVAHASRLFTSGFETRNITETEWTLGTGTTISFVGLNHSGKSANVSFAYAGKELHTGYSSGTLFLKEVSA